MRQKHIRFYFNGIKLSDYIIKKKKFSEDEALKIFKEILSVLIYLKEMYLCNLNLNSHNILIDEKNNIKICDFKFGHFYSPKEKSKSNLIGDHFSACPELHSKRPYNPELADVWSLGILLYQLITGTLPFKSQKDLELIRLIIRGDYLLPNSLSNNIISKRLAIDIISLIVNLLRIESLLFRFFLLHRLSSEINVATLHFILI